MLDFSSINIRTWALLGQRGTFGKVLYDLRADNERIFALTADQASLLGLAKYGTDFPNHYLNMGISEQNAIGVAAGLASEGYIPFVAFQAAFASMRCTDQVHVAMSYMKLNVKLIGIFSGLSQGECGPTHMSLHDIAIYRSFPNITILSPADSTQMVQMMLACTKIEGPVYMRIGGPTNINIIYKSDSSFTIGKAITLRDGADIAIIATGSTVYTALKIAELLEVEGMSVKVLDMHTISPLDIDAIESACCTKLLVTIEEHSCVGGLGSAVAEILSQKKHHPIQLIIGTPQRHLAAGSYSYLLREVGLCPEEIALHIKKTYKEI